MKTKKNLILALTAFLAITAASCSNADPSVPSDTTALISDVSSAEEPTSETTCETTAETTEYSDETAVTIDYEPVDYVVLDEIPAEFSSPRAMDNTFWDVFMDTDLYQEQWVEDEQALWDNNDLIRLQMYEMSYLEDEIERNLFWFGMDDPHLIDFITASYDFGDLDSDLITADSFDFFNTFTYRSARDGCIDGSGHFDYDETTLETLAGIDNRLARAIMVSLGRSYYVQEIPYSFFEEHFFNDTLLIVDDDWYVDDFEFYPLLEEYYSREEMYSDYLSTVRQSSFNSVDYVATWDTVGNMIARGQYELEYDPQDVMLNGEIFFSRVFRFFTSPVTTIPELSTSQYYYGGDYYTFIIESVYDHDENDYPLTYWIDFDSLTLYDVAYSYLPVSTIACWSAVRYNTQFYTGCRYERSLSVPLYRDPDNGAITMDLPEEYEQIVVDAYENAGYPLMTDDNGHIIPETPAHFREVYGEEYTDVLAEYGLV